MIPNDLTLEGTRVRLRSAAPEHLEGLYKAGSHSEIWTFSPSAMSQREDWAAAMNNWMKLKEQGVRHPFVILDKDTNEIVGSTSYLDLAPHNRKLEIGGTWLNPKVWRYRVQVSPAEIRL